MDVPSFKRVMERILRPVVVNGKRMRTPAVMVQGRHGVGKSDIIREIAEEANRKLIDKRIGQMSEGDLVGLLRTQGDVSDWAPPRFIKECCEEPVVLFLDEMNRGSRELLQSVFQMALDGELNGNKFHPDTVVICAINIGSQYQVQRLDPALRDRFFTVTLEPTVQDFLDWGRGRGCMPPVVMDFLERALTRPTILELPENAPAPPQGEKAPSRRSWEKFARVVGPIIEEIDDAGISLGDDTDQRSVEYRSLIAHLGQGFVGTGPTVEFVDYLKGRVTLTADDLLNNWDTVGQKKIARFGDTRWLRAKEVITAFAAKNKFTDEQARNFAKVVAGMPHDVRVATWSEIAGKTEGLNDPRVTHNVLKVHPYVRDLIMSTLRGEKNKPTISGALP